MSSRSLHVDSPAAKATRRQRPYELPVRTRCPLPYADQDRLEFHDLDTCGSSRCAERSRRPPARIAPAPSVASSVVCRRTARGCSRLHSRAPLHGAPRSSRRIDDARRRAQHAPNRPASTGKWVHPSSRHVRSCSPAARRSARGSGCAIASTIGPVGPALLGQRNEQRTGAAR